MDDTDGSFATTIRKKTYCLEHKNRKMYIGTNS